MNISKAFDEIIQYSHLWNWSPDWQVSKDIYESLPNSYSVLTPYAYSYLEELIRSTTSEYGREIYNEEVKPVIYRRVGMKLLKLAISDHKEKSKEYALLLEKIMTYYIKSEVTDEGDNRNSVAQGYMRTRFWSSESFEKLVIYIASLSKHSGS